MLKKFVLGGMVVVAALLGNACGDDGSGDSPAGPADGEVSLSSSSDDVIPGNSSSSSVTESPSTSSGQAPQSAESDGSSSSEKAVGGSSSSDGKSSSSSGKVESSSGKGEKSSSSEGAAGSSSAKVEESSSSAKVDESSSSMKAAESSSSVKVEESSSSEKPVESSSSEKVEETSSSAKPEESSSSIVEGLSSAIEISSNSIEISGVCKTELEDRCTYGSLYDERDGQTYKTVKIGEQWWMAENLRFEDPEQSVCFNDNPDNCLVYGKLYTRNGAINDCPNGWHLPTEEEWLKLNKYIKENISNDYVGRYLRADTLWEVSELGVGRDAFGFAALPGGVKDHDGWWGLNTHTHFWMDGSWKNGDDVCYVYALIRYKLKDDSDMKIGKNGRICDRYPSSKYSVRCVKD